MFVVHGKAVEADTARKTYCACLKDAAMPRSAYCSSRSFRFAALSRLPDWEVHEVLVKEEAYLS